MVPTVNKDSFRPSTERDGSPSREAMGPGRPGHGRRGTVRRRSAAIGARRARPLEHCTRGREGRAAAAGAGSAGARPSGRRLPPERGHRGATGSAVGALRARPSGGAHASSAGRGACGVARRGARRRLVLAWPPGHGGLGSQGAAQAPGEATVGWVGGGTTGWGAALGGASVGRWRAPRRGGSRAFGQLVAAAVPIRWKKTKGIMVMVPCEAFLVYC